MIRQTLLLAALCTPALGQTWTKMLNENASIEPHDVTVTTLDHTVVCSRFGHGPTAIHWIDANGVYREQTLDTFATSVSPRQDGGIFLVGSHWGTNKLWAGAMDSSGAWLWQWSGSSSLDNHRLEEVETTPDGGAVAIGWRYLSGVNDYDAVVYRFDATGVLLWARRLGDALAGDYLQGYDVDVFPDGKIAVSAHGNESVIALLDSSGADLWSLTFDNQGLITNVAAAQNGHVAVTFGAYLVLIDSSGTPVWQREYIPFGTQYGAVDLDSIPGGGFAIAGISWGEGPGTLQASVLRTTESGEVVWRRVSGQGPSSQYQAREIHAAPSGDIVAGASTWSTANQNATWAFRMTGAGTIDGCELGSFPTTHTPASHEFSTLTAFSWTSFTETPTVTSYTATPHAWTIFDNCKGEGIGSRYCDPGVPNSSGNSAVMTARGSDDVTDNDVTLLAYQLPPNQWGMFVTGMGTGTVTPPGSSGQLCLTGSTIHRFASNILNSGSQGSFELMIDVNAIPGFGAIQAGQTWNFQAWTRDVGSTSNFTDALSIGF